MTAAVTLAATAPGALATHAQPALDNTKLDYSPIGHFKPGGAVPPDYGTACDTDMKPLLKGKIFNPSGKWNAFDNNVFETICLPYRNQDDTSPLDPMGNGGGESRHGYCAGADPTDPLAQVSEAGAGTCPNHQLEFIEYFQATMQEILGDFGVTFQTYEFEHPEGIGRNPAAIVAGADHPDEHILIGSHYDQTKTGPASTWDSQEGHAEMIRIAKMMADYWRATGTRPSATVKFTPMDGEEDGLLGSSDYVNNTIVPDQEAKVRGYWNADPCAGGYPAYHYGNRAHRVDLGIQVGDSTDARVAAFNETVSPLVEQVFDRLDDTLETYPEKPELFVSTAEGLPALGGDIGRDVFIGTDQPVLFSSDWANFIAVNIPFFNPGPEVTGPNAPGSEGPGPSTIGTPEGLYQFHTPVDNLQTMMRYTGGDPTGMAWSEGWMKGMEFCAHMLSWGMLQHHQGGAQTANQDVVAYFEALPNEAERGHSVTFDGGGSYQYSDPATRKLVDKGRLQFKWDFADGSATAFGEVARHAFRTAGTFQSKLTVTNRDTGKSSSMTIPVVVSEGAGTDVDPAGQFVDNLPAQNAVVACQSSGAFTKVKVSPAGQGLRFELERGGNSEIQVDLFRVSDGRKASKPKKVASFRESGSFTWNGKPKRGRLGKGTYFVRIATTAPNGRLDARAVALERSGSKFKLRKAFQQPDSCELISSYRLASPAFGGGRALVVGFALTQPGKATISVYRGKGRKAVLKVSRTVKAANRFQRVGLATKKLRKGDYRVVLTVQAGDVKKSATLYAKKF
jgi:hypothetical protein